MTFASTELRLAVEPKDGCTVLRLSGVIDTNFPGDALVAAAQGAVVLDLDGVTRISSYGVRQWVKTVKDLPSTYCGFVRARPALVMQFNLMANFAGKGELLSLYLPYVCPDCEAFTERLVDVRAEHDTLARYQPPSTPCSACQKPADFDDLAESYLAYAGKAPRPNPPDAVARLVATGA